MSLVKNTIDIECLVQALQNVISAKNEHDKARDNYDGYSWGYYGWSYVQRMESAADEFGKRLDQLIEKKVIEVLENKK